MARKRKVLIGIIGASAVAAAVIALRGGRGPRVPGYQPPPPPPSRPPQRPGVDEAPRPASEPARPQVSDPDLQGKKPESPGGHEPGPEVTSDAGSVSAVRSGAPASADAQTDLARMSRDQLYAEARVRNVAGRSRMSKEELLRALSTPS